MTAGNTIIERVFAEIADSKPEYLGRARLLLRVLAVCGVKADRDWLGPDSSVDWRMVAEGAQSQGLLPLIHDKFLAAMPDGAEKKRLGAVLMAERLQSVTRNLALAAETIRLVTAFEEEGVRVIPFKGCILASIVYGDPGCRRPGDIDLLVQSSDVEKAAALLARLSYFSLRDRGPAWQAGHLGNDCEWEFTSRERQMCVDLHWNFTARNFGLRFPIDQIWARSRRTHFCGRLVEDFSAEDLILVLCVHAVKHYCRQLEWIYTIAMLLKRGTAFSWEQLLRVAKQYGALRHICICLKLADELYSVSLPENVRSQVLKDHVADRLAVQSLNWVVTGEFAHISDVQQRFFISATRISAWSKFRYWWAVIMTPNEKDFRVELPKWLWWGYPVFRLGRLIAEHIGIGQNHGHADASLSKATVWHSPS